MRVLLVSVPDSRPFKTFSSFNSVFIKGSRPCVYASSKNCAAVLFFLIIENEIEARDEPNHDEISRHVE